MIDPGLLKVPIERSGTPIHPHHHAPEGGQPMTAPRAQSLAAGTRQGQGLTVCMGLMRDEQRVER